MNKIIYVKGDVTQPAGGGKKIICQCCNNVGAYGAGVSGALSKVWVRVEVKYRDWYRNNKGSLPLGEVQFVDVEEDIVVANIIGQEGIRTKNHRRPVRYQSIKKGLDTVSEWAINNNASVHMPRIGCGLAGGTWDIIEKIIIETLINKGMPVTVYDL